MLNFSYKKIRICKSSYARMNNVKKDGIGIIRKDRKQSLLSFFLLNETIHLI